MSDDIKESNFISVNDQGHMIVKLVNGTSNVAGWLPGNTVPVDGDGAAVMAVGGELAVVNNTIAAGEDILTNAQITIPAGTQSKDIGPTATPAGPMPTSHVAFGTSAGDYLESIHFVVRDPLNAAVYLEDGDDPDVLAGTTGANPTASTTLSLTIPTATTLTANQLMDYILFVTYTPTNAAQSITVPRRITQHAAVTAGTTFAPVVTHNMPAGATVTGWSVRPKNAAIEIAAYNQSGAPWKSSRRSLLGRFRISVDGGVFAMCGGLVL